MEYPGPGWGPAMQAGETGVGGGELGCILFRTKQRFKVLSYPSFISPFAAAIGLIF